MLLMVRRVNDDCYSHPSAVPVHSLFPRRTVHNVHAVRRLARFPGVSRCGYSGEQREREEDSASYMRREAIRGRPLLSLQQGEVHSVVAVARSHHRRRWESCCVIPCSAEEGVEVRGHGVPFGGNSDDRSLHQRCSVHRVVCIPQVRASGRR